MEKDYNRLQLHLMPPQGWMNDPNGLCQFQGVYHVFYQYSPEDVSGGIKVWGHNTSTDLLHWKSLEPALYPDRKEDISGVFSGSAYVENDIMYLFYTGHVSWEGTYDDIYEGFDENMIFVTSKDGIHFSSKEVLLTNDSYPANYSRHVRDPKVWKQDGFYYLLQGARRADSKSDKGKDQGTVLLFSSHNLREWRLLEELSTKDVFGYMWECPDYFTLGKHAILSVSPQGLEAEEFRFQNQYQSGYFVLQNPIPQIESGKKLSDICCRVDIDEKTFCEWDMGFDFYAPQTFLDEQGRRILIGWAGMPDTNYDNLPTIQQGWQHALTIPRELTWGNGKIYQLPVQEMIHLRNEMEMILAGKATILVGQAVEIQLDDIHRKFKLCLSTSTKEWVCLTYENEVLELTLSKQTGRGRIIRKAHLEKLTHLQIFIDTSMLEIFVNHGAMVMTTRYYLPKENRLVSIEGAKNNRMWKLDGLQVTSIK